MIKSLKLSKSNSEFQLKLKCFASCWFFFLIIILFFFFSVKRTTRKCFKWRSQTDTASTGVPPTETNIRLALVNSENILEAAGSLHLKARLISKGRKIGVCLWLGGSRVEFGAVFSRRIISTVTSLDSHIAD